MNLQQRKIGIGQSPTCGIYDSHPRRSTLFAIIANGASRGSMRSVFAAQPAKRCFETTRLGIEESSRTCALILIGNDASEANVGSHINAQPVVATTQPPIVLTWYESAPQSPQIDKASSAQLDVI